MANRSTNDAEVAGRLAFVAGRLNRRIRSAGGGLSHGLLSALATVEKLGPIRLADLSQQEFVSPPSTTRLVAELEKRALVSRTVDPDDGRAFLIRITDAGAAEVQRARAARSAMVGELLSALSADEIDAIARALPAIERSIENDEAPPTRG